MNRIERTFAMATLAAPSDRLVIPAAYADIPTRRTS
jgi:hypothetical protein